MIKLSQALELLELSLHQGIRAEIHHNDQKSLEAIDKIRQSIAEGALQDIELQLPESYLTTTS